MGKERQALELNVLQYIDQHAEATQRQLSELAGVSLGTINLLLKRMVKKGWVKVTHLNSHSVKYFLTPAGIASKIERTCGYVARTVNEINRLKSRIVTITNAIAIQTDSNELLFLGEHDELQELIKELIKSDSFDPQVYLFHDLSTLKQHNSFGNGSPIIIWNNVLEAQLIEANIQWVNVMGMMTI